MLLLQPARAGDPVLLAHALLAPLSPELLYTCRTTRAAAPTELRPIVARPHAPLHCSTRRHSRVSVARSSSSGRWAEPAQDRSEVVVPAPISRFKHGARPTWCRCSASAAKPRARRRGRELGWGVTVMAGRGHGDGDEPARAPFASERGLANAPRTGAFATTRVATALVRGTTPRATHATAGARRRAARGTVLAPQPSASGSSVRRTGPRGPRRASKGSHHSSKVAALNGTSSSVDSTPGQTRRWKSAASAPSWAPASPDSSRTSGRARAPPARTRTSGATVASEVPDARRHHAAGPGHPRHLAASPRPRPS